jgi:hypothetical protein
MQDLFSYEQKVLVCSCGTWVSKAVPSWQHPCDMTSTLVHPGGKLETGGSSTKTKTCLTCLQVMHLLNKLFG